MLQCCVCLSSSVCDVRIVAKRCVLKQKLLLTAYTVGSRIWGVDWYQNDLDLCLQVEPRSCQPLRCIQRSLCRKPLEIVALFQRATNRKWPIGYQLWCEAVRSAILATAWLFNFFLLCLMCHYVVNWCDKLRFFIYICCFIAGFSYWTRLVSKQSWSHSHPKYIHDSFHFAKFQLYYMAVVAHYNNARSALL